MLTHILRSGLAAASIAAVLATSVTRADEMKLPSTAAEHVEMAKSYEAKAAEWRKEAAYHREMAASYKRSRPDSKGGIPNAEAKKMEKHCMAIVKDVEKLATDAEWSARYHAERAKELEAGGK